jgi:DNA-directed RNA polymerase specialized sigma24 family protein
MNHATHPPPPAACWQAEAARLAKVTAFHVLRLCKAHGLPPGEWDDIIGEALFDLCLSVRRSWARGVEAVDCRYFALHGLQAARTRRARPLRLLDDAVADPEAALASRGPGPDAEALARDELAALLARLPTDRLRRVVRMRAAGASTAEVAAALGCCRQRVEQLLQQARAVLLAR